MPTILVSLGAGFLFGLGLTISQMVNPAKVIGFLDVAGSWDPSLALVMAGALAVFLPAYRIIVKRGAPLFAPKLLIPTKSDIDGRLVAGAATFGLGWGLVGFCPGPAIAAAGSLQADALTFLGAMIAGMVVYEGIDRLSARRPAAQAG